MNKKKSSKKKVGKLKDEDLFGDFKEMDEFIESDNFDVTDKNGHKPDNFEITSKDKKKKAGHAKPPKEPKVEELADNDLFGDFKSLEEFERSESYNVTKSESKIKTNTKIESKTIEKRDIDDDDLFGDFKSLEEFEQSESYEVTKISSRELLTKEQTGPTPPGLPQTPSDESTMKEYSNTGDSPPPASSFGLKKAQQADQEKEIDELPSEPIDPAKQKLAAIAEKRRKKKKRGSSDDLFSDLDDFDLEDD
ncbi:MAG: hypothetical protein HeimC2_44230 [Candidatus Heimdallarchaeota archaeon LC_2]|nr:MAG: hypothetical protein HeimC2_44230 [Candidatus Heimdallarchaeota archaeon LC_2]